MKEFPRILTFLGSNIRGAYRWGRKKNEIMIKLIEDINDK